MMRLYLSVLIVVAGMVLSSCTQLIGGKTEIRVRRKFTLATQPLRLELKDSKRPYPHKVQIKKIEVPGTYDRDQIVFRLSTFELKEDKSHIWANRPSKMLTDVVEEYLNRANLFTQISQEFLDERPDYTLVSTIKAIERFDSGDLWYAHLAMSMKLVDAETNEVFWSDDFDERPRVYNKDMAFTVEALSQILRKKMERYISEIDFKFLNKMSADQGQPLGPPADGPGQQPLAGNPARNDTLNHLFAPNPDYEIIPGKLAPEED